ncbi:hypothetical protein ACGC1H_005665 [Rhizoctonia solani]
MFTSRSVSTATDSQSNQRCSHHSNLFPCNTSVLGLYAPSSSPAISHPCRRQCRPRIADDSTLAKPTGSHTFPTNAINKAKNMCFCNVLHFTGRRNHRQIRLKRCKIDDLGVCCHSIEMHDVLQLEINLIRRARGLAGLIPKRGLPLWLGPKGKT